MSRVRLVLTALLVALLLPAAIARASAYTKVLATYEHAGSIPPCSFSSPQLEAALKGVDTYGAQYFADFTNAIQTALAQRASGQCESGKRSALLGRAASGGSHLTVPGSVTAATGADIPAPILLLALFAVVLGASAGLARLAHLRGWDPPWVVAWRHSWAEAGYRMGGTWAEFRDWLRSA